MKKHYSLTLVLAAGLLTAFGAEAGTITTDSSGTIAENFPSTLGGMDARGDTVTGRLVFGTFLQYFPGIVTFNFVSPVTELGFDYQFGALAQVNSITLSNGDTFSLPQIFPIPGTYLGFISNLNGGFTSATVAIGPRDGFGGFSGIIADFRLTPGAVPEPSSMALIAPALLACAAALQLRKR